MGGIDAVVTGTSRGFGQALADAIVGRGGFVVGIGRTASEAIAPDRISIQGDLTEPAAVERVVAALGDRPLDLLIHNAAVGGKARVLADGAAEEIRRALEVDVVGPAALTEALLPALARADHPLVVLIGSRMGDVAFNRSLADDVRPASYAYRIAKAGVEMLAVALARELGDRATVLCVDPGPMATGMGRPGAERSASTVAERLLDGLEDLRALPTGSMVRLYDSDQPV